MDTLSFSAALLSALLHASWNAAVKAHPSPREAMAAQMIGAAVIAALGLVVTGLPPPAAWPWVAVTVVASIASVSALLRAYRSGGFGTVYPVARAVGVLCVLGVAPALFGEPLAAGVTAGVLMVAFALVLLTWDARRTVATAVGATGTGLGAAPGGRGLAHGFPPSALGWTLVAGFMVAAGALGDAQGVRRGGDAFAYGFAVSVVNAVVMAWLTRDVGAPWTILRRHARLTLPVALASTASYLLILWVYTRAPIAPASALRDTSALFAMVIAALWLKERFGPVRLAALLIALAGVALLRLG